MALKTTDLRLGDDQPGAQRTASHWTPGRPHESASLARSLRHCLIVAATAFAILAAGQPRIAHSQVVELVVVDVHAVAKGYRMSKLKGTDVRNDKNEKIGDIDDLIITANADDFVVIQVGGFLSMGGHLVAVPFKSLKIDDNGRRIVLPGASKDALKRLPEFKYGV